jgi:hypothetical protein
LEVVSLKNKNKRNLFKDSPNCRENFNKRMTQKKMQLAKQVCRSQLSMHYRQMPLGTPNLPASQAGGH